MVKDVRYGSASSPLTRPFEVIGNTLFFSATDGINGFELWKSDGTSAGTVMVKDIAVGSENSYPGTLTAIGNTLFFTANDGTNGEELWKSDGTAQGTVMVKDINNGSAHSNAYYFTAVGNSLFFSANDGIHGKELWKTDGTPSGTIMVKDIRLVMDIHLGSADSDPRFFTVIGNTLFFPADDGINGLELWAYSL